MSKFLVINVNDSRWNDIVFNALQYDFYHTQSYHLLDKENEAVLFVYYFDDNFIAIPLVIRSIPGSDLKDCTSVYGYCGPVSNIKFNDLPSEAIKQFNKRLNSFFMERKIVSSFSRLHPMFPFQEIIFKDYGEVIPINKTVAINLNQSIDLQRSEYNKTTKLHINRALKNGILIRKTSAFEDLESFIAIYYKNMQRVNANPSYYFSLDYFRNLINATDFNSVLFVAEADDEIIAGGIFTICNGIMQYHLGGTKNEMLKFSPLKLLIDSARIYANEMGCNYCHLGGGYSGANDSLLKFKAGFSKDFFEFKVWRKIINLHAYNELIASKFGDKIPNADYFPLYRF
ncbi:GNAT family N-acetyltransferase [Mariniphaga sp.]|uniref:GNAT family N-acetyltransferase n=1 Tax=Mariniphaga sp. TaxID=1954475 RepID=UPI0035695BD2